MKQIIRNKADVKRSTTSCLQASLQLFTTEMTTSSVATPTAPLQTYRVTINPKSSGMRTVRKDIAST